MKWSKKGESHDCSVRNFGVRIAQNWILWTNGINLGVARISLRLRYHRDSVQDYETLTAGLGGYGALGDHHLLGDGTNHLHRVFKLRIRLGRVEVCKGGL